VILGVTGMAGSGKSTLCGYFQKLGYRHISADAIGHTVLGERPIQEKLAEAFGEDVIDERVVNRPLLAERAFVDLVHTEIINGILHPRIREVILGELQRHSEEKVDSCLEAAILCETGLVDVCDWSVFLDCPFELRLSRVASRNWSEEELKKRDAQQDERLKADASNVRWKGPHTLGSLQRFSLLLDIVFRYERACSSKENAGWVLQQLSKNEEIYVRST